MAHHRFCLCATAPEPFSGVCKARETKSRNPIGSPVRSRSTEMKLPDDADPFSRQHPGRNRVKDIHAVRFSSVLCPF